MVTNNKLIDPSVIYNLDIFNFHRDCKAMATDFVSQNSSSGSHWLMLRMEASTPPPPEQEELRHLYPIQRTKEWPHALFMFPLTEIEMDKNDMNKNNKLYYCHFPQCLQYTALLF